jgi:hypothetical protein
MRKAFAVLGVGLVGHNGDCQPTTEKRRPSARGSAPRFQNPLVLTTHFASPSACSPLAWRIRIVRCPPRLHIVHPSGDIPEGYAHGRAHVTAMKQFVGRGRDLPRILKNPHRIPGVGHIGRRLNPLMILKPVEMTGLRGATGRIRIGPLGCRIRAKFTSRRAAIQSTRRRLS